MKNIFKPLYSIIVIALLLTAVACDSSKNITAASEAVSGAIDSSKWKFTATDVMPQYGTSRPADLNYDVSFSNNKLVVYLPYYGKADGGANILSGKSPLDFTSTDFTMDKQKGRKGQWIITIKPNDYREVQSMIFTFYSSGSANLSISMTHRTAISFGGNVEPLK